MKTNNFFGGKSIALYLDNGGRYKGRLLIGRTSAFEICWGWKEGGGGRFCDGLEQDVAIII